MKPFFSVVSFFVFLFVFTGCQQPESSVDYGAICAVETGYVSMLHVETPKRETVSTELPPVVSPPVELPVQVQCENDHCSTAAVDPSPRSGGDKGRFVRYGPFRRFVRFR